MTFRKMLAAGAVLAALFPAAALAGNSNSCGNGDVLSTIDARFDRAAPGYLNTDLKISDIDRVREQRTVLRHETQNVERHYCHARARMSDGKARDLWYVVEKDWGFASIGGNVTYCLSGLDPLHLHGRYCMSLR